MSPERRQVRIILWSKMSTVSMKPSRERIAEIAAKQDAKAAARKVAQPERKSHEEEQAAQMIQRNYRGYRERRQLAGMGLDSSTRWVEAIKEGQLIILPPW
ncbi:uncharacterized protein K441DRAFT_139834 [Cenococcum geophilum 1.58]|uniref:uncharacterized protein n=1 Tax=Cenococcum geophilum 1.58 TaxID=794803 RepID=UPI00358FEA33|nr:hypothetical protein K441DRAFT_139834 [Cenococcum geophilum 1.58]